MFIKVEVEFLDTVFYKINQERFTVGSAVTNHISFKLPSISKKHVEIFYEDDVWKIVDLGSTNGTYLVEQKLAKNKPVKLLLEESVRLGDMVFLTLTKHADSSLPLPTPSGLEEPEEVPLLDPDKTQIISLTALEKARLNAARKKKKELMQRKAEVMKQKIADGQMISKVLSIVLVLLSLAWLGNKLWIERMKKVDKEFILKQLQGKFSGDLEIEADIEGLRIPRKALLSRNKISKLLPSSKCTQEQVKVFCDGNPIFSTKDNGVIYDAPINYIFFVDEKSYIANVRFLLHEADKPGERAIFKFAFLSFFQEYLEGKEFSEEARVYLAFYNRDQLNNYSLKYVVGYESMRSHMISSELEALKFPGPFPKIEKILTGLDKYFTLY
jgi:pSer/pThr/pTyr-binding forkhead associated (FHA) protein